MNAKREGNQKKPEEINIRFEKRRWTARWSKDGKIILEFRTKKFEDLVAFLALNEPEAA